MTFKEDCQDIRNSKVFDMIEAFEQKDFMVDAHDPFAVAKDVKDMFRVDLLDEVQKDFYDVIVLAVGHREYTELGIKWVRSFGKENVFICDLKYVLPKSESDMRL